MILLLFLPLFLFADAHIFVFHRFGDNRHKSTNTSIKDLKNKFEYLQKNGYKVIKLSTLISAIKNKKKINNKWVVLTIDDNFQSFYDNGLKVFEKFHYPFTVFVYVQSTNDKYPDYTTWKELKKISKYGDIEFHSYSHPHMTYKSNAFLKTDFKKGLKLFEKHIGYKPKYFAYPYGEFDTRVQNIAKSFGFIAMLSQNIGAVSKDSNIFALDRNALTGTSDIKRDLGYQYLPLKWISPKSYPKNGILKHIVVKLNSNKTGYIDYYISKYGWHRAKAVDGIIQIKLNKKLHIGRNRIVIKVGNKIYTKLLIKDKYEHK